MISCSKTWKLIYQVKCRISCYIVTLAWYRVVYTHISLSFSLLINNGLEGWRYLVMLKFWISHSILRISECNLLVLYVLSPLEAISWLAVQLKFKTISLWDITEWICVLIHLLPSGMFQVTLILKENYYYYVMSDTCFLCILQFLPSHTVSQ
jgi:hypothetical protein